MNWEDEAKQILRSEIVRSGVTYGRLAELLNGLGVHETERSIANKFSRGTFSFVFALQCLKALGVETLKVSLRDEITPGVPLSSGSRPGPN